MHEVKFDPDLSKFSDLVDECCKNMRSIQFHYGEELFRLCIGILYCDNLIHNLNKHLD